MKRLVKILIWILCAGAVLACPAFTYLDIHRASQSQPPKAETPVPVIDVRQADLEKVEKLRAAPWQGLRFLPTEREWRMYGLAGEKRKLKLIESFDLVKVYYLQADGSLSYTWATEGVKITGQGYYEAASGPIHEGDLIEVTVSGEYVSQSGVDWEACESEYCHLAALIDTTLILDDQGTGITNGFIRHGWAPPRYPLYGFLVWQIRPYNEGRVQKSTK